MERGQDRAVAGTESPACREVVLDLGHWRLAGNVASDAELAPELICRVAIATLIATRWSAITSTIGVLCVSINAIAAIHTVRVL